MFQRSASPDAPKKRPLPAPVRTAIDVAKSGLGSLRAQVDDRAAFDRPRPIDALLYSDGASFTRLDGKYYERFCDPIGERLTAMNRRWQIVTPLNRYLVPRHSPSVFIQPRLEAARMRAGVMARLPGRPRPSLEGYDDALAQMKRIAPDGHFPDVRRLASLVAYLQSFQKVYARLLDRTRPRAVFIVCYYGVEPMGLVRECRARGIATIDIQHGTISKTHWAYTHWNRLPPGGYELLPNWFWVWAPSDAETISAWANASHGAHQAVVTGNPFLEDWRDGAHPRVVRYLRRIDEIVAPAGRRRKIIYTMNGYESAAQLEALGEAVSRSRDTFFWWVRQHPAVQQRRESLEQALRPENAGNYAIDDGVELPLYAVLREMDGHVTEASSTTIEAASFGVPTVLLSREEAVMYERLIAEGWARPLCEGEDLIGTLEAQMARGALLRRGAADRDADPIVPLEDRLRALLA